MKKAFIVAGIVLAVVFFSCAPVKRVETVPAPYEEIVEGRYDLIVVEGKEEGDSVAILDVADDPYEFSPAPGEVPAYSMEKGMSAREAMGEAGRRLRVDEQYPLRARRIVVEGLFLGYEMRALDDYYKPRPLPNLLTIDYTVEGGRVRFRVRAFPLMERAP